MVPNDSLINALRGLGYRYKTQTDRMWVYKKTGGNHRVFIRRNRHHTPDLVRILLKQANMAPEEIERFVSNYSTADS